MRCIAYVVASALVPFATNSDARSVIPTAAPLPMGGLKAPSPATSTKRSQVDWNTTNPTNGTSDLDQADNAPTSFQAVNETLPPSPTSEKKPNEAASPVYEYRLVPVSPASNGVEKKDNVAAKGNDVVKGAKDEKDTHGPKVPSVAPKTPSVPAKNHEGIERKVSSKETPLSPLSSTVGGIVPASPLPAGKKPSVPEVIYVIQPVSRVANEEQAAQKNETVEEKAVMDDVVPANPSSSVTRMVKDVTSLPASAARDQANSSKAAAAPVNPSVALTRMVQDKAASIPDARANLFSAIQKYRTAISQEAAETPAGQASSNATGATAVPQGALRSAADSPSIPPQNVTNNLPGNSTIEGNSRAVTNSSAGSSALPANETDVSPA